MNLNNLVRMTSTEDGTLASQLLGSHPGGGSVMDGDSASTSVNVDLNPSLSSGRRTSRVWKYFRMVDNNHYVCCLCNFVGAYTNTTNMRKHIQNHHPEIYQDILDHTRPSNRLNFLRSFQPPLFHTSTASVQYQRPYVNAVGALGPTASPSSNHSNISSQICQIPPYCDTDNQNGGLGDDVDLAPFTVPHSNLFPPGRDGSGDASSEHGKSSPYKASKNFYKTDSKADVFVQNLGEDRKVDITSIGGGNFTSGPSENSTGSGEAQGGCDEVSMPLSPEQFLSEDMDHGTSPTSTPFHQRPESYKLRHNNHLTLVLESLAGDESFMDVTLTAQGKAIKAHKSVLSAVSPYFRRVLKENPCQHPIIIMARDIRFEELNNIVSYVYKGEMTVPADELPSLLKTAENLEVTGLSPSEGSGGAGNIMSQMQGIPSGIFANTPSSNSSSSKSSSKKSSSKQSHPPQAPNYPDEAPPNYSDEAPVSSDDHSRIDPLDFLNTDMTCVKEEITSDNEEADEMSFSSLTADTTQTTTNKSYVEFPKLGDSVHSLSPRNDIGNLQTLASSSRENDDAIDKPFNPGELDDTPGSSPTESFSPHVCPHCMESHRPNDALQAHLRLKHPSKPSFVCACGRVFIRQYLYTEHMKKCDV